MTEAEKLAKRAEKSEFMLGALSSFAFVALVGVVSEELQRNKNSDAAPLLSLALNELASFVPLKAEGGK